MESPRRILNEMDSNARRQTQAFCRPVPPWAVAQAAHVKPCHQLPKPAGTVMAAMDKNNVQTHSSGRPLLVQTC
jgi:hypothetical protein